MPFIKSCTNRTIIHDLFNHVTIINWFCPVLFIFCMNFNKFFKNQYKISLLRNIEEWEDFIMQKSDQTWISAKISKPSVTKINLRKTKSLQNWIWWVSPCPKVPMRNWRPTAWTSRYQSLSLLLKFFIRITTLTFEIIPHMEEVYPYCKIKGLKHRIS